MKSVGSCRLISENRWWSRQRSFVKAAVRESCWRLMKKSKGCYEGRLVKKTERKNKSSKGWWRSVKKPNSGKFRSRCYVAQARWPKVRLKKSTQGHQWMILVLIADQNAEEEVCWRSLSKNVGQEGSDFPWNLRISTLRRKIWRIMWVKIMSIRRR